ncbi:DEAD/DEAH box helicase family protein [Paractinoplanes abujensis]|uniref:Uncharacterized protein n=1 Tax=Paractinoplanes abujensis TaxID=882441 RepID=A0A7W7CNH6_9ACTN|nr:DEAD/DEAH box helicase family protein [Actinoplanes abujensis]MBB4691534.1 hypothetical protein [Actinoplanes abujensis]
MVTYLAEIAPTSLVLVVTGSLVMAAQWEARLSDLAVDVRLVNRASAALALLENPSSPRQGVLITTYERLRNGPSRQALADVRPGLVILDGPKSPGADDLAVLARARSVIALLTTGQQDAWAGWPVLASVLPNQLRQPSRAVTVMSFTLTPHEVDLRKAALALLRNDAPRTPDQRLYQSVSLPSLHAQMLRLAGRAEKNGDAGNELWTVLDAIEDFLADDDRLAILVRTVRLASRVSSPSLVVAPTTADMVYAADALGRAGMQPAASVSASTSRAERRAALGALRPGRCVVTTPVMDELWSELPSGATVIILPTTDDDVLLGEILASTADVPGLQFVKLREA